MVVTKAEKSILLKEYKTCTVMLTEANRLNWTRYSIHLAISSALLTLWGTLWLYLTDKTFTVLISFCGALVAVTWFFINYRSMGYNDFWIERLRKIEFLLGGIMETFRKSREDLFWTGESFWSRRRIRHTYETMPLVFLVVWVTLILSSEIIRLLSPTALLISIVIIIAGFSAFYCIDRWHNKPTEKTKAEKLQGEERKEIDELQKNPPWRKKKKPKK